MGERDGGVSLAALLGAFSLATDLGLGQPMEHVLRSWWIASRLGERVGLDDSERADFYYTAVLSWVGCVADAPEVSAWFGDDIAFRADSFGVDFAGLPAMAFMVRHAGAGGSAWQRLRLATTLVATGATDVEHGLASHCVSTAMMADRLGLSAGVRDGLRQFFCRWDGSGVPDGVGGDRIARSMRLFHLADVVEVFHRTAGVDAAVEVARARRGSKFDPVIVDVFCAAAPEVLAGLTDDLDLGGLVADDPLLATPLADDRLDEALEVVADFTDLRSTFRAGHSRGVARLAGDAASGAGLPDGDVLAVRRAGLLHDVGLHGVPGSILDKPGPLTPTESERVRAHSYYTERTLARLPGLSRAAEIASLAHERLDGSGYHRGLTGAALPMTGRVLAAADAFQAMIEPRAHRPALSVKEATAALRREVGAGRLAADAVDAVLSATGVAPPRRRSGPAGLTPREVEVLVLIARGALTKQVARELGITQKTAGTHIERIYAKTGISTRSGAALVAVQHGLIGASG
ncbi:HD domain-containing protein [Actinomycetospora endophytica]|uniref:HD domain-containing protein n=1 Tax=Actinomycetospora endophytica TaxID=2291215 RepID=A0ABS8PEE6_9PSEU|nr:HD domain-containing phosphohydrolase [Actinomycetospora endophytica]MCD2195354.1 HD domain-containing protein [Actinomycetospora endophytica]